MNNQSDNNSDGTNYTYSNNNTSNSNDNVAIGSNSSVDSTSSSTSVRSKSKSSSHSIDSNNSKRSKNSNNSSVTQQHENLKSGSNSHKEDDDKDDNNNKNNIDEMTTTSTTTSTTRKRSLISRQDLQNERIRQNDIHLKEQLLYANANQNTNTNNICNRTDIVSLLEHIMMIGNEKRTFYQRIAYHNNTNSNQDGDNENRQFNSQYRNANSRKRKRNSDCQSTKISNNDNDSSMKQEEKEKQYPTHFVNVFVPYHIKKQIKEHIVSKHIRMNEIPKYVTIIYNCTMDAISFLHNDNNNNHPDQCTTTTATNTTITTHSFTSNNNHKRKTQDTKNKSTKRIKTKRRRSTTTGRSTTRRLTTRTVYTANNFLQINDDSFFTAPANDSKRLIVDNTDGDDDSNSNSSNNSNNNNFNDHNATTTINDSEIILYDSNNQNNNNIKKKKLYSFFKRCAIELIQKHDSDTNNTNNTTNQSYTSVPITDTEKLLLDQNEVQEKKQQQQEKREDELLVNIQTNTLVDTYIYFQKRYSQGKNETNNNGNYSSSESSSSSSSSSMEKEDDDENDESSSANSINSSSIRKRLATPNPTPMPRKLLHISDILLYDEATSAVTIGDTWDMNRGYENRPFPRLKRIYMKRIITTSNSSSKSNDEQEFIQPPPPLFNPIPYYNLYTDTFNLKIHPITLYDTQLTMLPIPKQDTQNEIIVSDKHKSNLLCDNNNNNTYNNNNEVVLFRTEEEFEQCTHPRIVEQKQPCRGLLLHCWERAISALSSSVFVQVPVPVPVQQPQQQQSSPSIVSSACQNQQQEHQEQLVSSPLTTKTIDSNTGVNDNNYDNDTILNEQTVVNADTDIACNEQEQTKLPLNNENTHTMNDTEYDSITNLETEVIAPDCVGSSSQLKSIQQQKQHGMNKPSVLNDETVQVHESATRKNDDTCNKTINSLRDERPKVAEDNKDSTDDIPSTYMRTVCERLKIDLKSLAAADSPELKKKSNSLNDIYVDHNDHNNTRDKYNQIDKENSVEPVTKNRDAKIGSIFKCPNCHVLFKTLPKLEYHYYGSNDSDKLNEIDVESKNDNSKNNKNRGSVTIGCCQQLVHRTRCEQLRGILQREVDVQVKELLLFLFRETINDQVTQESENNETGDNTTTTTNKKKLYDWEYVINFFEKRMKQSKNVSDQLMNDYLSEFGTNTKIKKPIHTNPNLSNKPNEVGLSKLEKLRQNKLALIEQIKQQQLTMKITGKRKEMEIKTKRYEVFQHQVSFDAVPTIEPSTLLPSLLSAASIINESQNNIMSGKRKRRHPILETIQIASDISPIVINPMLLRHVRNRLIDRYCNVPK